VLVFVHGYNTGSQDAEFRFTQIVADAGFTGVPILFTWPSQRDMFAYASDKERATASRDALERLLKDVSETEGVGRVHILAHSMGTWLAMEALRQNAIAGRPDLGGRLGDVILAAPDIDLEVFRAQLSRLAPSRRVSVFVASDDRALAVSGSLVGDRVRLGALNLTRPEHRAAIERLGVRVYDLTSLGSTDFFRHARFADAPEVVKLIGGQLREPRVEEPSAPPTVPAVPPVEAPVQAEPTPQMPEAAPVAAAEPAGTAPPQ